MQKCRACHGYAGADSILTAINNPAKTSVVICPLTLTMDEILSSYIGISIEREQFKNSRNPIVADIIFSKDDVP